MTTPDFNGTGNATSLPPATPTSASSDKKDILISVCTGVVALLIIVLIVGVCFIRRSYRIKRAERRKGKKYPIDKLKSTNRCSEDVVVDAQNGSPLDVTSGSTKKQNGKSGNSLFQNLTHLPQSGHTGKSFEPTTTGAPGNYEKMPSDRYMPKTEHEIVDESVPIATGNDENNLAANSPLGHSELNTGIDEKNVKTECDDEVHLQTCVSTETDKITRLAVNDGNVSDDEIAIQPKMDDCIQSWEYQYHNYAYIPDAGGSIAPKPPKRTKKKKQKTGSSGSDQVGSSIQDCVSYVTKNSADVSQVDGERMQIGIKDHDSDNGKYSDEQVNIQGHVEPEAMVSKETNERLRSLINRIEPPVRKSADKFSVVDIQTHEYDLKLENDYAGSHHDAIAEGEVGSSQAGDGSKANDRHRERTPKLLKIYSKFRKRLT